jgi:hypothetical protein
MMRGWIGVILMCMMVLSAAGQKASDDYQRGTVVAVTAHQGPGQHETDVTQYDVSIKVENTTYVVLFTPPNGSTTVKYLAGSDLLVLVGSNTLTFNSAISGKTEVPILSRQTGSPQSLDRSQACGQYFVKKLDHLSEILALTGDQQARIRPILEQETGEVGQVCLNSALSREEKLNQYKKLVRTSDEEIKPLLSASQLQKLLDMRKEQKQQLKSIIAEQQDSKQN